MSFDFNDIINLLDRAACECNVVEPPNDLFAKLV